MVEFRVYPPKRYDDINPPTDIEYWESHEPFMEHEPEQLKLSQKEKKNNMILKMRENYRKAFPNDSMPFSELK